MEQKSLLNTLLTWLVAAILLVIALKVVFILLGVTAVLVKIAFKLLPVLLAVWLAWMVVRWFGRSSEPDPLDL